MTILGIGIDIVKTSRFISLHSKHGDKFLKRIFHDRELLLWEGFGDHVMGRDASGKGNDVDGLQSADSGNHQNGSDSTNMLQKYGNLHQKMSLAADAASGNGAFQSSHQVRSSSLHDVKNTQQQQQNHHSPKNNSNTPASSSASSSSTSTPNQQVLSNKQLYFYQYYASRWAIKEAFLKALGKGSIGSKCIWVQKRDPKQQQQQGHSNLSPHANTGPELCLDERAWKILEEQFQIERSRVKIWCSLSHDEEFTVGQVILEDRTENQEKQQV